MHSYLRKNTKANLQPCSCRTGFNVDEIFKKLLREIARDSRKNRSIAHDMSQISEIDFYNQTSAAKLNDCE